MGYKKLRVALLCIGASLAMTLGVNAETVASEVPVSVEETELIEDSDDGDDEELITDERDDEPEVPDLNEVDLDVDPEEDLRGVENQETDIEVDVSRDSTPDKRNTWQKTAAGWQYLDDTEQPVTGLQLIDEETYYFDASGILLTGLLVPEGKDALYYFEPKGTSPQKGLGVMASDSWLQVQGRDYYLKKDGAAAAGWLMIDKVSYYFETEGVWGSGKGSLALGWKNIGGATFYFKKTGAAGVKGKLFTGWQNIGSQTFYFEPNGTDGTKGKLITGWKTLNGKTYYFYRSGAAGVKGKMLLGWQNIGGKTFYFKKTGARGVKGQMFVGFQKVGNHKFYFKKTGNPGVKGGMLLGWQKIGGKTYYFKKTGAKGTKGMMFAGGFITVGNSKYFFQNDGALKLGWLRHKNQWYYLNPKKGGAMATGWLYVPVSGARNSSYKFYFRPKRSGSYPMGSMMQDVSGLIGRQKGKNGYRVEVDKTRCVVTLYAKDESGKYRIPVKSMTCSVGLPSTPTPNSSYKWPFRTVEKMRWGTLMGPSYGQYCTRIVAGILFHSVAGSNMSSYNLAAGNYNMLGQPASHGCVRLCVRDAKWIYDNCDLGMQVIIRDSFWQPFDKPATQKIPAGQTWDPTDPNV